MFKSEINLIQNQTFCLAVLFLLSGLVSDSAAADRETVAYCVDPSWLPYEAIEAGQHIGLSADYIQILQANTTYDFKLVQTKDWQQSLQYIKTGQCNLLPMLNQTPGRSELEGLMAVANGDVGLFIGSVHSVNNHIQTLGLTNLKLAGWGGPDDSLRMGVIKGQETLLADINQALNQVTEQQHFEIYNRWNDVKVIDNTNYNLIWQVSLGSLFVLSMLLVRYFSMRNYTHTLKTKNRQLSDLQMKLLKSNSDLQNISQHDALTGLYNRHYFNQLIADDTYHNSDKAPLCLIFIDLDLFKTINDKHGHVIGDQVLKFFAQILQSCCHEGELVSRWGGEEFVILKQPATYIEAEHLCKRIQQGMQQQVFPHRETLTCSFGIAQMADNESLMDCFERADKMLYQAKNQGRNRVCVSR